MRLIQRPRFYGVVLGAATALCGSVALVGMRLGERLELLAFDWRVNHCNRREAAAPIVHVDIDDNSLERVGRWPWHRDELADLLSALHELGASRIAVDLILNEREPPRINDPRYARDADLEPSLEVLGALSPENVVVGDERLRAALAAAGRVFLPIQLDLRPPRAGPTRREVLTDLLRRVPGADAAEVVAATGQEPTAENLAQAARDLVRLRVEALLQTDFVLTEAEAAAALGVPADEVAAVFAGAKRLVAARRVEELFAGGRRVTPAEALAALLGDRQDRRNPDRADVFYAYRRASGLAAAAGSSWPVEAGFRERCHRAVTADPPLTMLAEAAYRIAAVNFVADGDGVTRRVPPVVVYGDRAFAHLGLAVAADVLGLDLAGMRFASDRVLVVPRQGGGEVRVPLDDGGNLIIPWTRTARQWRQGLDFPHLSAAKVWSLVDARRQMEANRVARGYVLAEVVAAAKGEVRVVDGAGAVSGEAEAVGADQSYRRAVNRLLAVRRLLEAGSGGRSPAEEAALRAEAEALAAEVAGEEQAAIAFVRQTCRELEAVPAEELAADPELAAEAGRFRRVLGLVEGDLAALEEANRRLAETAEAVRAELRPRLEGRHVFVGFAATAAGDIVTTPIDARTHGVMCHAQVCNAFLENQFTAVADRRVELLVCLLLSGLVAGVTAVSGPRVALVSTLALMGAYTAFNGGVVFMRWHTWLSLAGVMMTMAGTWAVVTLFRQLTAEREKRFFARQLSQYTAPAVAARIAESPEAARAFKTVQDREVTCFFSDLEGFTALTEGEDADVVQYVLNTYLARMSAVIWARQGLLNKFMGDGMMAFFNASVEPVAEHAAAACETALAVQEELEGLRREHRAGRAAEVFQRLRARVGLATGVCRNGDFGSDLKADYTVIGDVVNLAARLEPANKVFGTRIMVSEATRRAVGERYVFRWLADLQVKGKSRAERVYELVGRREVLDEATAEFITRFEAGVRLYQERRWDECIVHFTRLLARHPEDLGAGRYIEACQEMKVFPPPPEWPGALELKEK